MQITLRVAREMNGYTIGEVADHCGVTTDEYIEIENDPGRAQLNTVFRIANFLGVSLSLIYPGTALECIKINRSRAIIPNALTTF
ncbi:MAG: helix-turn-helix domain-containing protein [Desulfitobacteriaceae bacterium]